MGYFRSTYHRQDVCSHAANLVVENQLKVSDFIIDEAGRASAVWDEGGDDFYQTSIPVFSFGFNIEDLRKTLLYAAFDTDRVEATYYKVLEPFKVRGVTVGNADIYHLGRLVQPVLHSCLRDEKGPFRFIGKKNNVDDINEVYSGTELYDENLRISTSVRPWSKNYRNRFCKTFFVAGDYKNATDNMHPALPLAFISALAEFTDLGPEWLRVLRLTLGTHMIDYSKFWDHECASRIAFSNKDDRDYFFENLVVETKWGQLMGSPTSFPVLNIVNAAMLWYSVDLYENKKKSWRDLLAEYKPLFNGDDISFCSNGSHYAIWKDVCAGSGLSLSPGKNYCSVNYVNINSTNYINKLTPSDKEGFTIASQFRELFVINPGLLKGQAKVIEDQRRGTDHKEGLMPLCDQLETCVAIASETEKNRCYEVFLGHVEERLKKSHRSWILPRHLGGLGLPIGTVNLSQLEIALQQCKSYKDLSDLKEEGMFQELSNNYWAQLEELFAGTPVQFNKPQVLEMCQIDPNTGLEETPSLAMMFLDASTCKKNYVEKENKEGKKFKTRDNPEKKFLSSKRKFSPQNKNNLSRKLVRLESNDSTIARLLKTKLSKSGCNKRIRLDVGIPKTPFLEILRSDMNEEAGTGLDLVEMLDYDTYTRIEIDPSYVEYLESLEIY